MNISQLRKRMLEAGVAVPAIALLGAGFATPAYAQDDDTVACDPATENCDEAGEPVILVTGDRSTAVKAVDAERLSQNLAGKNEMVVAPNASSSLQQVLHRDRGQMSSIHG